MAQRTDIDRKILIELTKASKEARGKKVKNAETFRAKKKFLLICRTLLGKIHPRDLRNPKEHRLSPQSCEQEPSARHSRCNERDAGRQEVEFSTLQVSKERKKFLMQNQIEEKNLCMVHVIFIDLSTRFTRFLFLLLLAFFALNVSYAKISASEQRSECSRVINHLIAF